MMEIKYKTDTHELKVFATTDEQKKIGRERAWRDSELIRTDELVKLPDYPDDLLPYRILLRDYPNESGFPNNERPTI